jgi:hypothetical protein
VYASCCLLRRLFRPLCIAAGARHVPVVAEAPRKPVGERGALVESADGAPKRVLERLLLHRREALWRVGVTDPAAEAGDAVFVDFPERASAVRAGQARDRSRLRICERERVRLGQHDLWRHGMDGLVDEVAHPASQLLDGQHFGERDVGGRARGHARVEGVLRILDQCRTANGSDRREPTRAVVERAGEDDTDRARPERGGGRREEAVDGRSIAVLAWAGAEADALAGQLEVAVRRPDEDRPVFELLAVDGMPRRQWSCARQDLWKGARPLGREVENDQDSGRKALRESAHQPRERLDPARRRADHDHVSAGRHRLSYGHWLLLPGWSIALVARRVWRCMGGRRCVSRWLPEDETGKRGAPGWGRLHSRDLHRISAVLPTEAGPSPGHDERDPRGHAASRRGADGELRRQLSGGSESCSPRSRHATQRSGPTPATGAWRRCRA